MQRSGSLLLLAVGLTVLAGCHGPRGGDEPTQLLVRVPDRERFLDQALTTLREHDFQPRTVDRARGVAVAGPTTSKQWFEFWRRDVQDGYSLLESSLHTTRRIVTMHMDPQPDDENVYALRVQVDKARFSSPERQVTTASGALGIYSERLPTTEGLRNQRHALDQWIPEGRDPRLEAYLLDQIVTANKDVQVLSGVIEGPATPPPASAPDESGPARG